MLPNSGIGGLSGVLIKCLEQRDINAACGVVRRLLSEVADSDDAPSSSSLRNSPVVERLVNTALVASTSTAAHRVLKPASYSVLAHVSQRCDRWEAALVFAARMPHRPDAAFVSNLLTKGNWQHIDRVRAARGWQWNLPMALDRLGSVGAWDDALALAMASERSPQVKTQRGTRTSALRQPGQHTLGVLVTLLAQRSAAHWATALRVFSDGFFSGTLAHPDVLLSVLRSCALSGRWHVCLSIASMLDRTHQLHGVNDPLLFRQLVEISPGWRAALQLFERMRCNGVVPNQRTVELLLARCDHAGAWEAATHVFDATREDGRLHTIDGATSYKALVRSFHLTSQWERAVEALSWMGHASDAAAASGMVELVELSERSGQWDVALQVGAQLFDATPDGANMLKAAVPLASSTYLSLAFACAAGKQWATSMALYVAQLQDHRVIPHPLTACSVLQACLSTRGAWAQGLQFFALVHASKPRVVLPPLGLTLAMKLCVESQRWHEALQLLDVMHAEGLPLDNHGQKLGLWASALCGSWQASLRHYRRIPKHNRSYQDSLVVRGATKHSGPLATALVMRHLATQ